MHLCPYAVHACGANATRARADAWGGVHAFVGAGGLPDGLTGTREFCKNSRP